MSDTENLNEAADSGLLQPRLVRDSFAMWLVLRDGKPICARASEHEAKCYASGFSKQDGVEIIAGNFIPNADGLGRRTLDADSK